jgi:hypothetical protein
MTHEVMTEEPIRGQPFGVDELELALSVMERLPVLGSRAAVKTYHETYPELIEVTPPRSDEPRFFIWKRLNDGRIVVDGIWRGERAVFGRIEDAMAAVGIALIKGS